MKRVKNTETALKSNTNNWNSHFFFPTCVSWHYIKCTSPVQVSPTLFSLITLYFFSSKNLFVNPWSLCLIFTRLFTMLSTNLIKMYRVTRNILTQYKQNSIKSVFSSVLVFCLHSVKVCIDISITQHALVPSYSFEAAMILIASSDSELRILHF